MENIPLLKEVIPPHIWELLKEQLLIVLIKQQAGGAGKELTIPVFEVDNTSHYRLEVMADPEGENFRFRVVDRYSEVEKGEQIKVGIVVSDHKVKPMLKMLAQCNYRHEEPVQIPGDAVSINVYTKDAQALIKRVTEVNRAPNVNNDPRFN